MTSKQVPLLEIVVTARPSWARAKSILEKYCELYGVNKVRVSLVGPAISTRYGDISEQVPLDVKKFTFSNLRESDDLSSIALSCFDGSISLARHWKEDTPDCVLVIADRTETLGVSATAAIMQIPLIHLQGGEVSGSIDDKIRDTNSKLADLHLTTNKLSQKKLLELGENKEDIKIIGCPSIDLVKKVMDNVAKNLSHIHNFDKIGVGSEFEIDSNYGIIMFHPDTVNEFENIEWVNRIIEMVEKSNIYWLWFWPNPDFGTNFISKKLRILRESGRLKNVKFIINVNPEVFIELAIKAMILVGNSSFGIRESSFIGLPVINLGKRQIGREKSTNVVDLIDLSVSQSLISIYEKQINMKYVSSSLYGSGNAGLKGAQEIGNWLPRIKSRFRI